jgi:hypothetical protein
MKDTLKIFCVSLASALLLYAMGAFIFMEPNAAAWSVDSRVVLTYLWLVASVIGAGITKGLP